MAKKGLWKKRLLIVLGALVVIGGAIGIAFAVDDQLQYKIRGQNETLELVGQLAPGFELENVRTGEMVNFHELRGKVTVLQFFATWCPYCKEQMPHLQSLHEDEELSEVANFVAINSRESKRLPYRSRKAVVVRYLDEHGYTFPTLLASKQTRVDYRVSPIPAIVVLDRDGRIVYSGLGIHDADRIRDLVEDAAENG